MSGQIATMVDSLPFRTPGRILCGTVVAPDFATALTDYRRELDMEVLEQGRIAPDLARSWGAPAQVARPFALLRGRGSQGGLLRLVEGAAVPEYRPVSSFGWAAFELSVRDGLALHARLDPSAFRVLGPPKKLDGFDGFIPFQVAGRSGEVLYLNTVLNGALSELDLPHAEAEVDGMFIAVLAAEDRAAAVTFHVDALGFESGQTWTLPYTMINTSFGLPDDHVTALTMTRTGRIPACEVDQYPPEATPRPRAVGELQPGNALVTFAVADLGRVRAPFIEPPAVRDGPLYGECRVACVRGPASEVVELVEL